MLGSAGGLRSSPAWNGQSLRDRGPGKGKKGQIPVDLEPREGKGKIPVDLEPQEGKKGQMPVGQEPGEEGAGWGRCWPRSAPGATSAHFSHIVFLDVGRFLALEFSQRKAGMARKANTWSHPLSR